MVTQDEIEASLQEVDRRRQDLDRLAIQERQAVSRAIPQRRFGAGVSPQQQQDVLRRRRETRGYLQQIQQQRGQLEQ